jgi:beta-glucosidase
VIDTSNAAGVAKAVNASQGADLAIVVVGDTAGSCGESDDRMELDLIGNQLDLLEAVLATGTPVLTVLIHGRPVTFGGSLNAKWGGGSNGLLAMGSGGHAVLSIWRPGEEGGEAVADILLGGVQPGGRLAQPWPRSVGYVHSRAVPWWNLHQGDYDWGNKFPQAGVADKPWALVGGEPWSPLFCFGFGLSFSNYSFASMAVTGTVTGGKSPSGNLTVSITVRDLLSHSPSGSTVVQVYAAPLSASRTGQVRYKKTLVGFTKAAIAATGTTTVEVVVWAEELGYTVLEPMLGGADNHPRLVEGGEYRLLACRSECDCPLNTTVTVPGVA